MNRRIARKQAKQLQIATRSLERGHVRFRQPCSGRLARAYRALRGEERIDLLIAIHVFNGLVRQMTDPWRYAMGVSQFGAVLGILRKHAVADG